MMVGRIRPPVTFSGALGLELISPKSWVQACADPPYLEDVRSDKRKVYYKHELKSRAEHGRFLLYMSTPYIKAKVIICGYESDYYNRILSPDRGWFTYTYMGRTRGGMREETLWMNFNPLDYPLHDYRYIGENARQRHRIKKKVNREIDKLNRLPKREREAILNAIQHNYKSTFSGK